MKSVIGSTGSRTIDLTKGSAPVVIDNPHVNDRTPYVIINGIRFFPEDDMEAEHRRNYEPGGKYYHLRNEKDH